MQKKYFIMFMLICSILIGQDKHHSIGAGIGLGSFMGDFPTNTTLGTKLFYQFPSPFAPFSSLQLNFSYAQKIEKFLPGSYNYDHYSYFTSFGVSGKLYQELSNDIFINEGMGVIYLNDHSFDDFDEWNLGLLIGLEAGTYINKNLAITINLDYGLTFQNTNVSYSLISLSVNYTL